MSHDVIVCHAYEYTLGRNLKNMGSPLLSFSAFILSWSNRLQVHHVIDSFHNMLRTQAGTAFEHCKIDVLFVNLACCKGENYIELVHLT